MVLSLPRLDSNNAFVCILFVFVGEFDQNNKLMPSIDCVCLKVLTVLFFENCNNMHHLAIDKHISLLLRKKN